MALRPRRGVSFSHPRCLVYCMDNTPDSNHCGAEALLVRRARAGDRDAFDVIAGRHRAMLLALAFVRTGSLDEAEDLVQEVLTRAWCKLATLQDVEAFVPWLKAIAANACRNWYRRSRPWPESLSRDLDAQLPDPGPTPLQVLLERERQRELRQALLALPAANRMALMMHVWGRSYEEVAAATGVKVTTVEGRIHRARRQLRRLLRDEGEEFLGEPRRRWQRPQHGEEE